MKIMKMGLERLSTTIAMFFHAVMVLGVVAVAGAQPSARLSVTLTDGSSGKRTPARITLTDERGRHTRLPSQAIKVMYGRQDRAEGYGYQPDSAFYVDGRFTLDLAPGTYRMTVTKGMEYLEQEHTWNLTAAGIDTTLALRRWISMPDRGWYSSDDHIHLRRSPRENPLILRWIAAEDIHVGHLLQMGDYHATYFSQYAFGDEGRYREAERGTGEESHTHPMAYSILSPGQEDPRTHEIGHTISLAADRFVRNSGRYYYYDLLADEIHDANGLFGYAHQGVTFHGYRGLTLDVFDGKVDFMEILQTCVETGPLETLHYYHFLDLGFRVTATAGSDFPWCGYSRYAGDDGARVWDARIGNVRFYTYVGRDYSFEKWKSAFGAGRTFVSNGPVVDLKINGELPGALLDVAAGEELQISATAYGHQMQVPLSSLQLVGHGDVTDRVDWNDGTGSRERITLQKTVRAEESTWIAAKVTAGPLQFAHTTPVYIRVDGKGFYDRDELGENLARVESYLEELADLLENQDRTVAQNEAWRYRERLEERIRSVRLKIEELRRQADK